MDIKQIINESSLDDYSKLELLKLMTIYYKEKTKHFNKEQMIEIFNEIDVLKINEEFYTYTKEFFIILNLIKDLKSEVLFDLIIDIVMDLDFKELADYYNI